MDVPEPYKGESGLRATDGKVGIAEKAVPQQVIKHSYMNPELWFPVPPGQSSQKDLWENSNSLFLAAVCIPYQ